MFDSLSEQADLGPPLEIVMTGPDNPEGNQTRQARWQ